MARKLADPTKPYAEFIYALTEIGGTTVLDDYVKGAVKAGGSKSLWTVEAAKHMAQALKDEIVVVEMTTRDGKEVSGYAVKPESMAFWANAREAGVSVSEALAGWNALMTLLPGDMP